MTSELIHSKLQTIFRDVFDDNTLVIARITNADDVSGWDSLAQINLVVAIENDFAITLSLEDMATLSNVGDMLDLIQSKIAT